MNVGEEKDVRGTRPPASEPPASSRRPSPTLLSGGSRFTTDEGCNQRYEPTGALLKGPAAESALVPSMTTMWFQAHPSLLRAPLAQRRGCIRTVALVCEPQNL